MITTVSIFIAAQLYSCHAVGGCPPEDQLQAMMGLSIEQLAYIKTTPTQGAHNV